MRLSRAVTLVSAGLWIGFTHNAAAGLSHDRVSAVVQEFNTVARPLRSAQILHPVTYLTHKGRSYGIYLPSRLVRIARTGERFELRGVEVDGNYASVGLESTSGARGHLLVTDDGPVQQVVLDEVVERALGLMFDFGSESPGDPFSGNRESHVLHASGCNHLPPADECTPFATEAAALAAGFRVCGFCFPKEPLLAIEGYGTLRAQALEAARVQALTFPPVADSTQQTTIQKLGESILARFPVPLRGYDYQFRVLHSRFPQASSLPTGLVFITDQLLSAIEDTLELELVLAHEIAHVELLGEGGPTGDLQPALTALELSLLAQLIRWRETESDVVALLYLIENHPEPGALIRAGRILSKLEYFDGSVPGVRHEFATHPSADERGRYFAPASFQPARDLPIFEGLGSGGQVLLKVWFVGVLRPRLGIATRSKKRPSFESPNSGPMAVLVVESTDLLNETVSEMGGRLDLGDRGDLRLEKTKLPFPLDPGELRVVQLAVSLDTTVLSAIVGARLDAGSEVKCWRIAAKG